MIAVSLIMDASLSLCILQVMDMLDMKGFADDSFDVVIDKAAMDALMTEEGDVWNPKESLIEKSRSMCRNIARIMKPGGHHLQISFQQPHFRKKYLLGWHGAPSNFTQKEDASDEFGWSFRAESIQSGGGGCFHNFLYIMRKSYDSEGEAS
jgi:hypothetical protein